MFKEFEFRHVEELMKMWGVVKIMSFKVRQIWIWVPIQTLLLYITVKNMYFIDLNKIIHNIKTAWHVVTTQ